MSKTFITVPMTQVQVGEKFTPIEKRGEPIWDKRRKRWDRKWAICPESYISVGKCHGITFSGLDPTIRDGLFATGDWAIVERESASVAERSAGRLAKHFAR